MPAAFLLTFLIFCLILSVMEYSEIIIAVFSAVSSGSVVALLNWYTQNQQAKKRAVIDAEKSKSEVKRSEFEIIIKTVNELQEENARLQKRLSFIEEAYDDCKQGVLILTQQLIEVGQMPRWTPGNRTTMPPPTKKKRSFL